MLLLFQFLLPSVPLLATLLTCPEVPSLILSSLTYRQITAGPRQHRVPSPAGLMTVFYCLTTVCRSTLL
jgi:hypothetical protein